MLLPLRNLFAETNQIAKGRNSLAFMFLLLRLSRVIALYLSKIVVALEAILQRRLQYNMSNLYAQIG